MVPEINPCISRTFFSVLKPKLKGAAYLRKKSVVGVLKGLINVWFQEISIPTQWKVIKNSEGEGGRIYNEKYEAQLEIPGGTEGSNEKLSWGRYGYFLELHNIHKTSLDVKK